ncbi:MAG: type-F conjugative transfer system pilin assembly protein TrbC [Gammaproteobacteria bacterium]
MKNILLKVVVCFLLSNAIIQSSFAETGNILIFISFSMPKESIKGWMNEAKKTGASVIVRGLINNSFKDTVKTLTELAQDNRGGVQLDPTLFQRYQIEKVPAVVVVDNVRCLPNQSCKENYDVVYGDITLSYALNKIANQNDDLSIIARQAIIKLRDNHEA